MRQKLHLFLIEMVVVLALFAVSATVCVGLLVQAHTVSRESEELTQAVYYAESAAENWKAGREPDPDGPIAPGSELTARYQTQGNRLTISIWKGTNCVYEIQEVVRLGHS